MRIDKFILGVAGVVALSGIGILSVEALSINNSSFNKGLPVFRTVYLRSEGKDKINGSTNPEYIKLDNSGMFISSAILGSASTVFKLNASSTASLLQIVNSDIVNDAISTSKILDGGIENEDLADVGIESRHIQNATLNKVKFDPALQFPTSQIHYTNNVCTSGKAITSVNNGTATCTDLPNGLPTCSEGQWPTYQGGIRTCGNILITTGDFDSFWTGSLTGNIRSAYLGNVGVGLNNPSAKLSVSGSLSILGYSEETVYCYATDAWIPISSYNAGACAGCNSGFTYNVNLNQCEETACAGTGSVSYTAVYVYASSSSEADICNNMTSDVVYINSSASWVSNTQVYSNTGLTTPVPAGTYIKEQGGSANFQVDGAGRIIPTGNSC